MRPDFPRTLAEFQSRFATEEPCRRYLVACRWPDGTGVHDVRTPTRTGWARATSSNAGLAGIRCR
jgi:hypothetical protein